MTYYFAKTMRTPFDDAVSRLKAALQTEGFGVLTDIDVKETLKAKLGVEFRAYRILGACNPGLAYEALQCEDKVGTMLPCNVIVQEKDGGEVEVAAIDPVASMQAIQNKDLTARAHAVREKLQRDSEPLTSAVGVATVCYPVEPVTDPARILAPDRRRSDRRVAWHSRGRHAEPVRILGA